MNEWGGEFFDRSTTPSLRATPPVPGGELIFLLLQFIHTFIDPDLTGVAETGGNAVDRCTEGIVDFRTVFSAAPAAE